jgi:hypothetical protein
MNTRKSLPEYLRLAKQWLDTAHPTLNDGEWSIRFILEVYQGQHRDHANYLKVRLALSKAGLSINHLD